MDTNTAQALIRFGLGRRGEEPLPADPRGWLLGQLQDADPGVTPTPTTAAGTWPGVADAKLLDGRDLRQTADARAIAKGLLVHHLGLPQAGLAQVFPSSEGAAAAGGLIRA